MPGGRKMQKKRLYLLAFLIPVVLLLGVMYIRAITPFGDKTVLIWDALIQYKDFFGYLWDVFHGNASIEYSAGKSLGGRTMGLFGYYLSSPLNVLLLFFQKSQIPLFMAVMTVLRVGLCGSASAYYLQHRFALTPLPTLLLSTSYALCEYNIYNCRNIMWLDGVILLPLVAAGVWKFIKEGKPVLLWFSVILAIICNWYTGYMVCLMSGIYFAYEYVLDKKIDLRKVIEGYRTVLQYVFTMLLAVLTSMAILLPALLALVGAKASSISFELSGIIHFDLIHFLSGFNVLAAFNRQDAPMIFCGTITLLLVVCYFCCHNVSKRERAWSGALLLLLACSFCFQDLELLWTAYNKSFSYFFRFSFVFIFTMIMLAGRALQLFESKKITGKELTTGLLLVLFGVYLLRRSGEWPAPARLLRIYAGSFLVILLLVWKAAYFRFARIALVCFSLLLAACELFYNADKAFQQYYISASSFAGYTKKIGKIVGDLNIASGGSFYRFEKNFDWLALQKREVATGESLLYNYNSIEHYSSTYDAAVDRFLADMGYSDWPGKKVNTTETYWNSPILLTDSLLSVKYLLLDGAHYGYEKLNGFPPFYGHHVMENKFSLPFGYNVSKEMGQVKFGKNPYKNQNILLKAMLQDEGLRVYRDVSLASHALDGKGNEVCVFKVVHTGPAYVFVDGYNIHKNKSKENCSLYLNGKLLQTACWRFHQNSVYLGDWSVGDTIKLVIKRRNTGKKGLHTIYAAQLDTQAFEEAISRLSSASVSNLNIRKNVISGVYTTEKDSTVFLSIPYEDSWTCFVDGKETALKRLANTFIGIDLKAGTHDILIVYTTPGLRIGIIMSVIGLLFSMWFFFSKHDGN